MTSLEENTNGKTWSAGLTKIYRIIYYAVRIIYRQYNFILYSGHTPPQKQKYYYYVAKTIARIYSYNIYYIKWMLYITPGIKYIILYHIPHRTAMQCTPNTYIYYTYHTKRGCDTQVYKTLNIFRVYDDFHCRRGLKYN